MRMKPLLLMLALAVMLFCPLLASAQCSGRARLFRGGLFGQRQAAFASTCGQAASFQPQQAQFQAVQFQPATSACATGSCQAATFQPATFSQAGSVTLPAAQQPGFANPVPAAQIVFPPPVQMPGRIGLLSGLFGNNLCPNGNCNVPTTAGRTMIVPASSTPTVVTFGF